MIINIFLPIEAKLPNNTIESWHNTLVKLVHKGAVIIRLEIHKEHNCAILWARTDENTNVLPPEFSAEIDALRAGNKRFRLILMRSV